MKQHNLVQGSPEWHQYRSEHYGASEASAMLGLSPYESRTELLHKKATGISKDVNAATQRIFNNGHKVEALARPIIESILGEELYPVTCSEGNLSASCDGLTMDESIAWEHKQWNQELADSVKAGILPEHHWPQCQQVLLVTGAEQLIFTVSDGTLDNMESMTVYPDKDWFERIKAGWAQFDKDLASYAQVEAIEPAKAEAVMSLPALAIQVGGAISIQSNLDKFGLRLNAFLAETKTDPETDQDFANLEQACKVLKDAEEALIQAETHALAQTADIDEMRRTVAYLADIARTNRLKFEKIVKTQKEAIKAAIVLEAKTAFTRHCNDLETEIAPIRLIVNAPDFASAIKNKRTVSSLRNAVDTELANAKIAADAVAKSVRMNLNLINGQPSYQFLFNDAQQIVYKSFDDLKLLCESRIEAHQKAEQERMEAERQRIQAEEAAKAKAEQERHLEAERAKIRAEEAAKAKAEQDRIVAESKTSVDLISEESAFLKEMSSELDKTFGPEAYHENHKDETQQVMDLLVKSAEKAFVITKESWPEEATITIAVSEYEQLKEDSAFLDALRAAGINNWSGYDNVVIHFLEQA